LGETPNRSQRGPNVFLWEFMLLIRERDRERNSNLPTGVGGGGVFSHDNRYQSGEALVRRCAIGDDHAHDSRYQSGEALIRESAIGAEFSPQCAAEGR